MNYLFEECNMTDTGKIVEIYNSNRNFLRDLVF